MYVRRRERLLELVKNKYPVASGALVFFAHFEEDGSLFKQESTFLYLTGITEPGAALMIELDGRTTLFVPAFKTSRHQWVHTFDAKQEGIAQELGVDAVVDLGDPVAGYALKPYGDMQAYSTLITELKKYEKLYVLCPMDSYSYVMQRFVLSRLCTSVPELIAKIVDISPLIAQMRRIKDMHEIEAIQHAIEITAMAHEVAGQAIEEGVTEAEIQGVLEYAMIAAHARPAFPSIVGTGKNSTVLHYCDNKGELKDGELVVIDIGAQADGYCADITRTYPVSGKFTERQKILYQLVLDTQEYIAQLAAPGMWLSNDKHPDQSLHHLAKKYLADNGGYDRYFPHGIGHFLGLDVHDVGDAKVPLQEGDVITIEPGIYIPEESIGIRIEDNYWIVKGGAVCLSESIPKTIHGVEQLMSGVDISDRDYEQEEGDVEAFFDDIDDMHVH